MATHFFSYEELRQTDIVEYLEKLGYQPQKITNNDYWYLSPLRDEKEASFKVNRKLNAWFDHGSGKGGNFIDFGVLYHKCSFEQLIEKIENFFSFHPGNVPVQPPLINTQEAKEALEPKIKVIAARPLTNSILCRYLDERKIPVEIAQKHCKEVYFELHDKRYFAIGFENKSGGFELRNSLFKGSSSPKDITQINTVDAKEVAVFEGFFSFLSYQTLHQKNACLTNFLVLNSLSFFVKSRQFMEEHDKINLYLDRDEAGIKNTQSALKWDIKYIDKCHLYENHKDLNDYLLHKSQHFRQGQKLGRHF
ncbi:toprim domain-containing protein [Segetibacter koreensis]|uniref:toprim domain-containing protein n=1 Tax=Segetibacter koreensis TaxID=398037 RepID=UPI00038152B2|nr:toprim domain-containing protein [Segetibacter koreensis]